ncbi:hypothetical protein [Mesobacillus maritimus]
MAENLNVIGGISLFHHLLLGWIAMNKCIYVGQKNRPHVSGQVEVSGV